MEHRLMRLLARAVVPLLLALSLAPPATAARPAVVEARVIGHSVDGRPIRAWHLGEQGPGVKTVVVIATMHGDEDKVSLIPKSLRDGSPIRGVDLWVVPTYNPDGRAKGTRQNARGVDLNRNYPVGWIRTTGRYDSGRKPASEPETQAMMAFLREVDPDVVLSFHQPLNGVDTDTKRPAFSRKVAKTLHLPTRTLACNGSCHGTMTMWFNKRFDGIALTVEYGASPSSSMLRGSAARGVLRLFGARR
ncbi:M14 family zinc carboxypeptidase [Nocardioides sp.]|uniref:M14 family zinc carboxypeptidase n=1 Tax=Nocardioides sp. TaxID=35761 RepID=UPI0039E38A34